MKFGYTTTGFRPSKLQCGVTREVQGKAREGQRREKRRGKVREEIEIEVKFNVRVREGR